MRKLLATMGLFLSLSAAAFGAQDGVVDIRGGDKPFPWGTEAPFPWKSIEGTWASEEMADVVFVFKIIRQDKGTRYLQVAVIDVETGKSLAEGVGVARRNDRIVRSRVKSTTGAEFYILLSNYQRKDPDGTVTEETYLTLRPISNDPKKDRSYYIQKLDL